MRILAAAALLALLAACSSRPPMRPVNEISEPLFYPLDYVAVEALAGGEFSRDFPAGTYAPGFLFEPRVAFEKNINPWAGFSFWPLFWNLLLTGDPYDAGGNPEVGKLNVTAHGGLNGLGYSSRDGWFLSAAVGARAKYLLDERFFLRGGLMAGVADLAAPGKFLVGLESGLGWQATPVHSLLVSHALWLHKADAARYHLRHGLRYGDGDLGNEVRLGHKAYLTPSHIVGPEVGYGFRNHGIGETGYFLIGVKYRYVVE